MSLLRPALLVFSAFTFLVIQLGGPATAGAATDPAGPTAWLAPVAQQDTADDERDEDRDGRKKPLPLEAADTLRFTVTEGSWISVDVTPDGRTLVFDLLGDLYTLPIEGGRATSLTRGMAFDGQPRVSPDGDRVVFTSDRDGGENLWILSLDGTDTVQVTKGKTNQYHSPEWTPDGDYIVATKLEGRWGASKLWLFHAEGGSGVQLIDRPENLKTLGAAFGSDPRYIWFAQRQGAWDYNAEFPQFQLALYDRETGRRHTQSALFGSAFRPTLSPDGKWLAYGTRYDERTGLRIRDLDTGDERWLAYPVQRDDQESRATRDVLPGMTFTPDSRELIASYGGKLWRIPVDGGAAREIPFRVDVELPVGPRLDFEYRVDDSPRLIARQVRDAIPAPNGQRLAFTALDRLWTVDVGGGTPRRLTEMDVAEHHPSWSPDGRWIAYVTWSLDEGGHINRVRADGGSRPERLTPIAGFYRQPEWSPDGERIVAIRSSAEDFRHERGGFGGPPGSELVWIPSGGGDLNRIAPAEGRTRPHFVSDEPDRIYVYQGGGFFGEDAEGLISMRWDGTDVKTHVKVRGSRLPGADEPMDASLVVMSPEGGRAFAQVANDLYVVTVPYVGAAPTISVSNPGNAAFPVRKLTVVGGQFPAWSADGERVHWSIGNSHFIYDLADAKAAAEDSARAAEAREEEEEDRRDDDRQDEGDDEVERAYEPREVSIRVNVERDIPRGTAVLRGARVITMRGDEVIEDADLLIRDNRVAAVGPRGRIEIPADARVIDVAGKTIVPGFVDTHAHLRPPFGIHRSQVWEYLANLAYGVTTTRDPQTGTTDVLSYGDLVETGALVGPRIYSTGPGVFWIEQIESLEHARDVLRRYSDYYDTKTIKQYVAGNRQQRQWIIMAAQELELMPTTEGALDMKLDLTQIIDGYPGHEHSFPIFPLYRDVLELTVGTRAAYTPTLLVSYGGPFAENWFYTRESEVHGDEKLRRFTPHDQIDARTLQQPWFHELRHVFDEHAVFVKDLVEAGGLAGVGSHGQLQGLGYHWELWAMASGGISNHDALRVATIQGAEAIGLETDLGSIEPGKMADLLVLDANPLTDIRNTERIRYVMKNGRLYEGETLDEVWPRERTLPDMWWQGNAPATAAGLRP